MVVFPNCKINLGLRVLSKRADGFHDLDTVFFPIPLKEAAEIVPAHNKNEAAAFQLHLSGHTIVGSPTDNLCYRAWSLLKRDYPDMPPLEMYLHKAIPSGAGLGGGSSDAAFTLKLINEMLGLQISTARLLEYALVLGSDCPFFILNKPCYATGRGEKLVEIDLDLSSYDLVLVHPPIHISTGWAFSEGTKRKNPALAKGLSCMDVVKLPVSEWRQKLVNDFEDAVFEKHPEIAAVKEIFYKEGAAYASLTGTGSCVYGLFDKKNTPSLTNIDPSFKVYHLKTVL